MYMAQGYYSVHANGGTRGGARGYIPAASRWKVCHAFFGRPLRSQ